jgi:hypothetical protein
MALPIEDYALIGDRHTAALVGRDGSVDWLCLPRFDSPACFAALLGDEHHGRWLLGPADEARVTRRYVGNTALLETTFTTETGTVTLLDVMPTGDDRADVVRRITGVSGSVRMRHEWIVRCDYGRTRPWVTRRRLAGEEVIVAVAGPDQLMLRGPRLPHARDGRHVDEFEVTAGEELTFSTTWVESWRDLPQPTPWSDPIEWTRAEQERWQPGHAAHDDPRRDRWHRGRADHEPARGLRWRAQLGLPLLLAPRRRAHPGVPVGRRLLRGGPLVAELAAARRRR